MYDDIAHEPLPRDVVELIEKDGLRSAEDRTPQEAADQPVAAETGNDKD